MDAESEAIRGLIPLGPIPVQDLLDREVLALAVSLCGTFNARINKPLRMSASDRAKRENNEERINHGGPDLILPEPPCSSAFPSG